MDESIKAKNKRQPKLKIIATFWSKYKNIIISPWILNPRLIKISPWKMDLTTEKKIIIIAKGNRKTPCKGYRGLHHRHVIFQLKNYRLSTHIKRFPTLIAYFLSNTNWTFIRWKYSHRTFNSPKPWKMLKLN